MGQSIEGLSLPFMTEPFQRAPAPSAAPSPRAASPPPVAPAAALGTGIHRELPSGSALLIVHRGPSEGSEFLLPADADIVGVGRSPESEVFLDDVTVSRRHAEFRRGSEGWSVRDVGSLNGTYVNRVRVDDQSLKGGDEVQIGKFRFVFLVGVEPGT